MEWIIGCGCLSVVAWIAFMCAQLLGLNAFGTVGFIIAVFLVLGVIAYFSEAKETRNKIKENIDQPDKLENVLNILNDQEKKELHNFIIVQLAKINDSQRMNIICQQCFKCRNPLLIKLIIEKSWIASQPAQVKVYTILKNNQLNLIKNSDGEEVKYLLDSLKDKDIEIVNRAKQSLEEIKIINQLGIDYLCQEWLLKQRDKFLESIIVKHQYQAVSPLRVKILTALKIGQLELLSNLNLEETIIVVNALDDSDQLIANNAQKMGDFLQDSTCKSLIYFITEQWVQYERIDFDQNLLKNIFNNADSTLRKKITEKIKISGRSDWLQVIFAERKRKNIESMTDYDWQVTVELLSTTDNDHEKWRLAQQAPAFYSHQLLKQIHSPDLINSKKSLDANLFNLGKKVIPNPSDLIFWINENSETITLTGSPSEISRLVMNREGTLLASASNDNTIKLWQLPSGRLLHTFTGHTDLITSLVMNGEGTLLASASNDNTIKLWELPSGRLFNTLTDHTDWISSLAMNRKGTLLASGSGDKSIKLWALPSGRLLHTLTDHTAWIKSLVMNREGTFLASASGDNTIKLWDLPSGRLLNSLTGHTGWIRSLVMNREGNLLASGSADKTIKLWELYSFDRLPVSKIVNHCDYIQDTLKRNNLTENERNWFEFMLALVNNYRSFEIDIEDAPIIAEAGEFDIEIEG